MTDPARPLLDPAAAAPARGRRSILGLLMLVSAANQIHRNSLSAVGDQIMGAYSISPEAYGALSSIFGWTYTVCMLPAGILADRIGTWRTLSIVLLGSSLYGVTVAVLSSSLDLATSWWWGLAGASLLFGMTSAPIYPSTSRTVACWFAPRWRVLGNSLVIGAALLGLVGAQQMLSRLSTVWGWRPAFLAIGLATLVPAALWMAAGSMAPRDRHGLGERATGPSGAASRRWAWLAFFSHPGIVFLTLSYSTIGYFEYLFFYWSKYYFKEVLHLTEAESANYTTVQFLTMMVCTPLGGAVSVWAVRRWGARRGLKWMGMATMSLAILFLTLGALEESLAPKLVYLSLALGMIGASEGPFWTAAVHLGGRHGGASGGFVNTGGNLLGYCAPIATPWIAGLANAAHGVSPQSPFGWTVAVIAGGILCAGGVVCWLWVDVDRPLAD